MFVRVFQEGANINKSLTTLGKVISALAEQVINFHLEVVLRGCLEGTKFALTVADQNM